LPNGEQRESRQVIPRSPHFWISICLTSKATARPKNKLTDYALTNPKEYFSEGFRMDLQSPETQAQLKQRDPKLFARLHSILGAR
jgi:hypothetical protein